MNLCYEFACTRFYAEIFTSLVSWVFVSCNYLNELRHISSAEWWNWNALCVLCKFNVINWTTPQPLSIKYKQIRLSICTRIAVVIPVLGSGSSTTSKFQIANRIIIIIFKYTSNMWPRVYQLRRTRIALRMVVREKRVNISALCTNTTRQSDMEKCYRNRFSHNMIRLKVGSRPL